VNREAFVGRVRRALGRSRGVAVAPTPPPTPAELVAASVTGLDAAALAERFVERSRRAGAHVHLCADAAAATALAIDLVRTRGATAVADASPLAQAIVAADGVVGVDAATADIGITRAWRGVAETGTVVLRSDEGRLAGLLPPVHLAFLAAADLRPGLTELYADAVAGDGLPAHLVQITGPSRTADIEMTLVTGVHGPGEVHVVLFGART
jgi:L-lactate dehydrogenase complex protein LldG